MLDVHHAHHHMNSLLPNADALQWAGFASIFTYSFLVSLHCIGMCGPLACSMLYRSKLPAYLSSVLYNFGRTLSYALAGALASLVLRGLSEAFAKFSQILAILFGIWICIFALMQIMEWKLSRFAGFGFKWAVSLQKKLEGLPPAFYPLALGFLTLLLPCMTLHPLP